MPSKGHTEEQIVFALKQVENSEHFVGGGTR